MSTSRSREKLSTQEQIGALVDEGLLRLLRTALPPLTVKPGVTHDEVMYEAGTQRVVSFLDSCRKLYLKADD